MHMTLLGGPPPPLRRACLRQGAGSAGFQPASGQDGRAPRGWEQGGDYLANGDVKELTYVNGGQQGQ